AAEIPVAAPFGLEAFGLFRSCERPVDDRARAADVTRLEPQLAEVPGGDGGELVAPRGVRGAHGAIPALDRFSAKPGDPLAVARTKRLLAEKVAELDRRDDHVLRLLRVVLRARELALGEDEGALGLIERQLLRDRLLEERGRDRQSSGDAKRKRGARGTDEIGRGLRRIVELADRELEARLVEIETAVEIVISRKIARDETSSGQSLERGLVVAEAVARPGEPGGDRRTEPDVLGGEPLRSTKELLGERDLVELDRASRREVAAERRGSRREIEAAHERMEGLDERDEVGSRPEEIPAEAAADPRRLPRFATGRLAERSIRIFDIASTESDARGFEN